MPKLHKFIAFSTLILLISISLVGCGGETTTENKSANAPANNAQADKPANTATENKTEDTKKEDTKAEDTKKEDTKAEDNKETASADKIGVAECDEYIEKYEICLKSKVPETSRAMMKEAFEKSREAWKTAAASPQGKAALAQGCKTALETAKTTMASFNCAW